MFTTTSSLDKYLFHNIVILTNNCLKVMKPCLLKNDRVKYMSFSLSMASCCHVTDDNIRLVSVDLYHTFANNIRRLRG